MSVSTEPRRHPDGSIDVEFYKARAIALRRQAVRDAAGRRMTPSGALVMAGALGFAIALPSTAGSMRDYAASAWPDSFTPR